MMLIYINKFRCGTYKVTRLKQKVEQVEQGWSRLNLTHTHLLNVDRLEDGVDVSVDVVVDDVLVLSNVGGVGVESVERAGGE